MKEIIEGVLVFDPKIKRFSIYYGLGQHYRLYENRELFVLTNNGWIRSHFEIKNGRGYLAGYAGSPDGAHVKILKRTKK